jgi:adenylate kinase family enzyme
MSLYLILDQYLPNDINNIILDYFYNFRNIKKKLIESMIYSMLQNNKLKHVYNTILILNKYQNTEKYIQYLNKKNIIDYVKYFDCSDIKILTRITSRFEGMYTN